MSEPTLPLNPSLIGLAAWLLCAAAPPATLDLTSHSVGAWGVDLTDQDRGMRPGDDFYRYQNGGWLARTELGPTLPRAAYWIDLRRLAPRRLIAILEEAAADTSASPTSPAGKAGAFYRAFMDEKLVEAKGVSPLQPELDSIRAATTRSQLAAVIGSIAGPGTLHAPAANGPRVGHALFLMDIGQDQADPSRSVVYVKQGGLLLPGPEYYVEPQFADVRVAYTAYAAKMLELIGWPDARTSARQIVELETRVAAASWSHEAMLDAVKTYNPMPVAELARLAPGFDWGAYLGGAGLAHIDRVVIDARSAFPGIASAFADTPLGVLQARQALAAADARASNLNAALAAASFDFHAQLIGNAILLGAARDLRAEQATEASLSDIVGALYVARHSSPQAKAVAMEMAANLRQALGAHLDKVAWMSPASRTRAREKLAKMRINIGYPDRFDDYEGLAISDQDLYGNARRAAAYGWRRRIGSLGQPFDRSEWGLTPEYPNYNYVPSSNTVEIPAALLQPPFFDARADAAVNYGAVGSLIGEMLVTAFSSQGIQYDGDGRLRPWLAPEDADKLMALSRRVSAQYSSVEPLPGQHLKGELLVDEAISDLGGLQIALDAYHASLKGQAVLLLDGYTGDQRFFLARAQLWRAKFAPAFVRTQIATGANAPTFMRVNGPLPNIDAWYAAFGIKPGDRMYVAPQDRVRIW